MHLKNKKFSAKKALAKQKKLDVVLRQLTGDTLTEDQRQQIKNALGCRRQYRLKLCRSRSALTCAAGTCHIGEGEMDVRALFDRTGEQDSLPIAVLVCRQRPGEVEDTVYICLSEEKEDFGNETRKKETEKA